MEDLMTITEVMKYLKAGYRTVKLMIAREELTPVPWAEGFKYRREEVERIRRGDATNASQD